MVSRRVTVRFLATTVVALLAIPPRNARAFGEAGAFQPRVLLTGGARWEGARSTAPARWSAELLARTSAPAKTAPGTVRADEPGLLAEPFALWGGDAEVTPLSEREVSNLRDFIALGGILLVDDFAPETGAFSESAKRELGRVLPEGSPISMGPDSIVFKSFYLVKRAVGRVDGKAQLEAIIHGGVPQVIFTSHDLMGALARGASGVPAFQVTPGGEAQREQAVRLAVNLAMYVLCSTYKEDLVHQSFLKRRHRGEP
jgi:hypothetical protein